MTYFLPELSGPAHPGASCKREQDAPPEAAGAIVLDGCLACAGLGLALGSAYVGFGLGDFPLALFMTLALPLAFLAGMFRDRWACLDNARRLEVARGRCFQLEKQLDEARGLPRLAETA